MQQAKRILVAGGAGFVGSNLTALLVKSGAWVDCVDNLSTGRVEAIQPLRSNPRFRFLRMDIVDPAFVGLALSQRYDEIYHLACPTGVPNILTHGEDMMRSCALGTEQLLKIACASNARLVYASSAEVYGNPDVFPQREEYCGNVDPVGPRSPYEEGKRFGEAIVRLHAERFLVDARIVRIFNTYGPGMSPGDTRVIPHSLCRIRQGQRIIVYGDGKQTRTHLYVDDLIDALRLIAAQGERGGVYNVGGEKAMTILALVDILRRLSMLPVEVEHQPHFIEDHGGRLPGIDKVKALGWKPRVRIETGLERMLESLNMPVRRLHRAARAEEEAPARRRVISIGHVREGRATR